MAHDIKRIGGGILMGAAPTYRKLRMALEQTQEGRKIDNIDYYHLNRTKEN